MPEMSCLHCGKNIDDQAGSCPYCRKPVGRIPNYPSLSPKWFMVIWVFFLVLIVALLVSMFTQ